VQREREGVDTGDKVPVVLVVYWAVLASFASPHCDATSAPLNSRHRLLARFVPV